MTRTPTSPAAAPRALARGDEASHVCRGMASWASRTPRAPLGVAALVGLALCGAAGPLVAQEPAPAEGAAAQPEIVDGVDYRVYDRTGAPASIESIVRASLGEEVLLVGEEHDDMVGHAFQTRLLETVVERIAGPSGAGRPVVLSLEMFERDVQIVVDEYMADLVSEDHFLRSSRPWDDYRARYRPAVEVAKAAELPVVAANAPRRYVNRVSREGPESLGALSERARAHLPPLPYPGPSTVYRAQWDALMSEALAASTPDTASAPSAAHDSTATEPADVDTADEGSARSYAMSPNVIWAQALWDAAMGHAIAEALVRNVGGFVVHFAGSFHVERGTGIPERIADYRPGTRVVSVVMTKVDDIEAWSAEEHAPLADFVVLTRRPVDPGAASN